MNGAEDETRALSSERGAIMVMAAGWMGVLVLMAIFVVDIGNWFEHKRHLQLQADAGALAAAGTFGVIDPDGCDDSAIEATAKEYGGIAGANVYNAQIGGTPPEEVHLELNSRTYFGQGSPVDDTVIEAPPCTAKMVDVKMTETDLPWYFKASGLVPFINAHARVSILQANSAAGALPVGVPDPNPERARVTFIDEETGEILGSRELTKSGTANGLALWSNAEAPLPVEIDSGHVGVRVALSGSANNIECDEPLVDCYDGGSADGIVHLQGWSAATDTPRVGAVRLVTGSGPCSDPYFSYSAEDCTFGVQAEFDFGADPATVGAELKAVVGNRKLDMTYDAGAGVWSSPATFAKPPAGGPIWVGLEWRKTENCTETCSGAIANVQRTFAGSDSRSGPIRLAQVSEAGVPGANSFERCSTVQASCTHDLVVTLGLQGSLENASDVNDPLVSLRVVGGSQTQALDCDPAIPSLRDEIAAGCGPTYEKNQGTPCPDATEPFDCVPLQTGTQRNHVAAGMNQRVLGDPQATTCPEEKRNQWSQFPNLDPGDPRIIQVFLTPFGSFEGSGNASVPVTGFATFYVTGWKGQGNGFANPCEAFGDDAVPNDEGGYLVGHFIKYVQTLNNGGGGTEPCDFNAFGSCVAVLTK